MAKTIIKEVGIVLLLLIAIILVFAIVFYDYIPNNKTVPIALEAYELPEDVQNELAETLAEGENIVTTYYIDSSDLSTYESSNDYDKGKANPFAEYTDDDTDDDSEDTNSTNTTSSTSTTNSTNTTSSTSTTSTTSTSSTDDDESDQEVYVTTPGKNS